MDAEGPIADEEMGTVEIPPTDPPLDEEDLEDFLYYIYYVILTPRHLLKILVCNTT